MWGEGWLRGGGEEGGCDLLPAARTVSFKGNAIDIMVHIYSPHSAPQFNLYTQKFNWIPYSPTDAVIDCEPHFRIPTSHTSALYSQFCDLSFDMKPAL